MKDSYFLKNDILECINDTTNDIIEYIKSDAPIECYSDDINKKMNDLKKHVTTTISYYLD